MEYLLGLSTKWKSNSSVRECERDFRRVMEDKNERENERQVAP